MDELTPGEKYWMKVVEVADHIVWDDNTRASVVGVYAYLVGTLALTEIADCACYAITLAFNFEGHVATLLHGMAQDGYRGVSP